MIDNLTLSVIRERRSTLDFTSGPVTDDQVEALLEAGRWLHLPATRSRGTSCGERPQLRAGMASSSGESPGRGEGSPPSR